MNMAALENVVRPREAPAAVWWTMFAGPFAWICNHAFSYVLAQHSCSTGHHYVLHVVPAVCAVIALSGFFTGWKAYEEVPKEASDKGARPMDRARFQTLFGMVFSLAFTVVILAEAVPPLILNPCQ